MAEKNICDICGGVKSAPLHRWKPINEVTWTPVDTPYASALLASRPKFCVGHPKGAPKHDGKLDDKSSWARAKVEFHEFTRGQIEIFGGYGDIESSRILLDAKQAISLLSWLEQNKPELTALAEQEQS